MCAQIMRVILSALVLSVWAKDGVRGVDENATYDGYRLYKLTPKNDVEAKRLTLSLPEGRELDILKLSDGPRNPLEVLVSPRLQVKVENLAKEMGIPYNVSDHDFQRTLDSSMMARRSFGGFSFFKYNSYDQILKYMKILADHHDDVVKLEFRGKSFEGRPLVLMKISSPTSSRDARKPIIFIDAGVHAREWVAPSMAIYIMHRIVEDSKQRYLLDYADFYILPVVNPDGYEYSRASPMNRMWRKTRSRTAVSGCYGVDGNRNYGFKFGSTGATTTEPCNPQTYAGPKPFSEVETRIVRDIMHQHANRIKLYVSLHAYGDYLVYPWGYTGDTLPRDWEKLDNLARKVSNSIVDAGGQPMTVKSAGQWYPASGGSDDYAFGVAKIPYSYTMELTKDHSFLFPEERLTQALPQYFEGFRTFALEIGSEFGLTSY